MKVRAVRARAARPLGSASRRGGSSPSRARSGSRVRASSSSPLRSPRQAASPTETRSGRRAALGFDLDRAQPSSTRRPTISPRGPSAPGSSDQRARSRSAGRPGRSGAARAAAPRRRRRASARTARCRARARAPRGCRSRPAGSSAGVPWRPARLISSSSRSLSAGADRHALAPAGSGSSADEGRWQPCRLADECTGPSPSMGSIPGPFQRLCPSSAAEPNLSSARPRPGP